MHKFSITMLCISEGMSFPKISKDSDFSTRIVNSGRRNPLENIMCTAMNKVYKKTKRFRIIKINLFRFYTLRYFFIFVFVKIKDCEARKMLQKIQNLLIISALFSSFFATLFKKPQGVEGFSAWKPCHNISWSKSTKKCQSDKAYNAKKA